MKATLTVMGKKFTGEGKTVSEAIAALKPDITKAKSILLLENGERKRERILTNMQTMRLFSLSPLMREIALKQVSQLFDV